MILAIDANVLVGELLRQRGRDLIANPRFTLYVTEQVLSETEYELRRRITFFRLWLSDLDDGNFADSNADKSKMKNC